MKKTTLILSSLLFSFLGLTHGYSSEMVDSQETVEILTESYKKFSEIEISFFATNLDSLQPKEFTHFYDAHTQTLNLSSPNSPLEDVIVYNVLGQEVLDQKFSGRSEILDMSGLVNGLYIVKVSFDKDSKIIKVLKQ